MIIKLKRIHTCEVHTVPIEARVASASEGANGVVAGGVDIAVVAISFSIALVHIGAGSPIARESYFTGARKSAGKVGASGMRITVAQRGVETLVDVCQKQKKKKEKKRKQDRK